jgi:hypothetical protein
MMSRTKTTIYQLKQSIQRMLSSSSSSNIPLDMIQLSYHVRVVYQNDMTLNEFIDDDDDDDDDEEEEEEDEGLSSSTTSISIPTVTIVIECKSSVPELFKQT